jgi:hypothetical protein
LVSAAEESAGIGNTPSHARIALLCATDLAEGGSPMPVFTVVASGKDGKTVELAYASATQTLHEVHALRNTGCHIVTIYRDGEFLSEEDLVIQADAEATNKQHKSS